jgi:hypothetical protein
MAAWRQAMELAIGEEDVAALSVIARSRRTWRRSSAHWCGLCGTDRTLVPRRGISFFKVHPFGPCFIARATREALARPRWKGSCHCRALSCQLDKPLGRHDGRLAPETLEISFSFSFAFTFTFAFTFEIRWAALHFLCWPARLPAGLARPSRRPPIHPIGGLASLRPSVC